MIRTKRYRVYDVHNIHLVLHHKMLVRNIHYSGLELYYVSVMGDIQSTSVRVIMK